MGRGYDKHQERKAAVAALGRALARRAKSTCELSGESGVRLQVFEVPPVPEEPELDRTVLVSERVLEGLSGAKVKPGDWRFLEAVVWSENPAVQVLAVRMLRRFGAEGAGWAQETLDGLYLSPEIEAWIDAV